MRATRSAISSASGANFEKNKRRRKILKGKKVTNASGLPRLWLACTDRTKHDAKVSVPVVETQTRIDDHERRPPPLTERETTKEKERGEERRRGEEKKSDIPR